MPQICKIDLKWNKNFKFLGFDPLLNIVLDNTIEYLRDPDDPYKLTDDTRQLGLVVCRGPNVMLICPQEGMEPIANPFASQE